MKKLLSLMLALVMVVGVMAPVKVNAVEEVGGSETLFNTLRTRLGKVDGGEVVAVMGAIFANTDKIYDALESDADIKEYLEDKYIKKETISGISNIILNTDNLALIKKVILDKDVSYSSIITQFDTLIQELYGVLPLVTQASIEEYAPTREDKINVLSNVINELLVGNIGNGNYSLKTNGWVQFNLNVTEQMANVNKNITGSPLKSIHTKIANNLLNKSLNSLEGTMKNIAGNLLLAEELITKIEVDKPVPEVPGTGGGSTGGGGGGSTAPTTPTPPTEVEVPEDSKDPITVTIGKESVTITTNAEGTTTIVVKETETIKAVEALRKEAGKDREATIVVELADVKGLDFVASLPSKLIESLVKNNVSLQIKTAESEVYIPAETLAGINIPAGSTLELRVDEVANTEATKVAPVGNEVKRVVDLSLIVINGTEQRYITTFRSPITVKIDVKGLGNIDKLAVYYLNEDNNTLEFVTGKTEDNNVVLKLRHFSKYVIVESNKTFKDIIGHWSKKFVESMAAKNVVSGYDSETFRPEGEVTRAEFARMIVGALELDVVKYDGNFADVKADAWYADYVATMNKAGFVAGYSDGTFKPDNKITRAEMAQMLSNALDFEVKSTETNSLLGQFKDLETIQTWSKAAIAKVAKAKVMVGDDNKNFNPISTATRAEATTAIYNLYNK